MAIYAGSMATAIHVGRWVGDGDECRWIGDGDICKKVSSDGDILYSGKLGGDGSICR